jgi:hypothetical protein
VTDDRPPGLPLVRPPARPPARNGDDEARRLAEALQRGVCRMLEEQGFGTLVEFRLPNGRRADVIGLNAATDFVIVEVKTSVADLRADLKWPEYLPYCNAFYFAVPEAFPQHLLPAEHGVIVADAYDAAVIRPSAAFALHPTRRRSQLLRFALTASARLSRLADPRF